MYVLRDGRWLEVVEHETLTHVDPESFAERLLATSAGRIRKFAVDDVEMIEAADDYVRLYARSGRGMIRGTIKGIEQRLDPAGFPRVHRSTIVNLAAVQELRPLASDYYTVVLRSGGSAVLSQSYRDEVLRRLA